MLHSLSSSHYILGEFGIVYHGQMRRDLAKPFSEVVAVKTLKGKIYLSKQETLEVNDLFVASSFYSLSQLTHSCFIT